MPKRKTPELEPKEQFKRFQEAAKEHGVHEKGEDRAGAIFKKLASAQKAKRKTSVAD